MYPLTDKANWQGKLGLIYWFAQQLNLHGSSTAKGHQNTNADSWSCLLLIYAEFWLICLSWCCVHVLLVLMLFRCCSGDDLLTSWGCSGNVGCGSHGSDQGMYVSMYPLIDKANWGSSTDLHSSSICTAAQQQRDTRTRQWIPRLGLILAREQRWRRTLTVPLKLVVTEGTVRRHGNQDCCMQLSCQSETSASLQSFHLPRRVLHMSLWLLIRQ